MPLVSFEEIKDLLHLEDDSIDDYPALKRIHASILPSFESFLGRKLIEDSYTETHWTDGSSEISLKALPIKKVKSVFIDGNEETEYRITQYGIKVPFKAPGYQVVIKYSGGFEEIPDEIRSAALLQVAHEYQRHDQIGATSVSNDGGFVKHPELGLLKEVKRRLQPFKNYAYWGI